MHSAQPAGALSDSLPDSNAPVTRRHPKETLLPSDDSGGGDVTIMAVSHVAWITVAGDEEYRSHYAAAGLDWRTYANNNLENADNAMYSNFGIDFYTHHYVNWDSNDSYTSLGDLLNELQAEVPHNGGDFRQGFTYQYTTSGRGIAYILGFSSLVKHKDDGHDWHATQHETSHIYGARDRYRDPNEANLTHVSDPSIRCVMADAYNDYSIWCWWWNGTPDFDYNYLANYNTRFD